MTALQIREKLAALAAEVIPSDKVDDFKEALKLKSSPNGGVAVTDDLKYTSKLLALGLALQYGDANTVKTVKFSRQNGIHGSPTVLWDGLVANEISSSWGEKEWTEFLAAKIQV